MNKHYFSKKYGISEKDIDESLIPLFIAQDRNEKYLLNTLKKNTESHAEIISKIKGSINTHNYNNLDQMGFCKLFVFRWGWTLWILPILAVWAGVYTYMHSPKEVIPQVLQNSIEVNNGRYFISKKNYTVKDGGVYIKATSK